jgi:hypothetical protein
MSRFADRLPVVPRPSSDPPGLWDIRAVTSAGDEYGDPSEDLLLILLSDDLAAVGDFVIVERPSDPSGQTYVQAIKTNTGYEVEHRDGSPETHMHAATNDVRAAHADMTTWAFGLNRERVLSWQPGPAW